MISIISFYRTISIFYDFLLMRFVVFVSRNFHLFRHLLKVIHSVFFPTWTGEILHSRKNIVLTCEGIAPGSRSRRRFQMYPPDPILSFNRMFHHLYGIKIVCFSQKTGRWRRGSGRYIADRCPWSPGKTGKLRRHLSDHPRFVQNENTPSDPPPLAPDHSGAGNCHSHLPRMTRYL